MEASDPKHGHMRRMTSPIEWTARREHAEYEPCSPGKALNIVGGITKKIGPLCIDILSVFGLAAWAWRGVGIREQRNGALG